MHPSLPAHPASPSLHYSLQSSLRLSLGVRSVRTAPGQAPLPADDLVGGPSLAQEIYRKYAGKTQPESKQLVAILAAVQEVVRAQGLEPTPTAMFAALMARCGLGAASGLLLSCFSLRLAREHEGLVERSLLYRLLQELLQPPHRHAAGHAHSCLAPLPHPFPPLPHPSHNVQPGKA